MATNQEERTAFARRLRQACTNAGMVKVGATNLLHEFSLRYPGHITVHAVRKWLMGESIPSQDKLRALAGWLQVSPDWLRFGTPESMTSAANASLPIAANDVKSLTLLRRLDEENRAIADEMIKVLLRAQIVLETK